MSSSPSSISKRTIFILSLVVLCMLYFIPYKINQYIVDLKVTELCQKDGGIEVFEQVILSKEAYEKNEGRRGSIAIFPESNTKDKHDYFFSVYNEIIGKSDPQIKMRLSTTYRKIDMKIMQVRKNYYRRGGDAPTFSHLSSFSCLDVQNVKSRYETKFYSLTKGILKNDK